MTHDEKMQAVAEVIRDARQRGAGTRELAEAAVAALDPIYAAEIMDAYQRGCADAARAIEDTLRRLAQ